MIAILILSKQLVAQQVCTGSLGDPISGAGTDFGRGPNIFGPSIPVTTYRYVQKTPEDGEYTLAKTTRGLNGGWLQDIRNHTPNDPDGYMMVVNADFNKDVFYKATVTNLCPKTTYEFAAYIINMIRGGGIKPNVTFSIYDVNRNLLGAYTTGDIPVGSSTDWKQYALIFTTPANSSAITIELSNENPGGGGNDLALDDITFRACGPTLNTNVSNRNSRDLNFCSGDNQTVNLNTTLSPGYTDPAYQWQKDIGTGFTDIAGETNSALSVNTSSLTAGNYNYRVRIAESANIGSPNCGVVGESILVNIFPIPIAKVEPTNPVCAGETIQLKASGGISYSWSGPNGFTSTEQNPVLTNVTKNLSGTYKVVVSANGCDSEEATTSVLVKDRVTAKTKLAAVKRCPDEFTQLEVTESEEYTYSWFPTDGLSNSNISNPIASPKKSTTYTVTVSNGVCSITDTTRVIIAERQIVNAGEDLKLFAGQSKQLNATIIGTDYTFYWSPVEFLDDPTSLNPTTSSPKDITYTLNVTSACFTTTDEVFVKVYPEIIIPNAFSPNGDGINDTWTIPAASAFDTAKIKIYNRYGNLVYQNEGLFEAWDGKYKGQLVSPGVYYYTAYFNRDFKMFSGPITLLR